MKKHDLVEEGRRKLAASVSIVLERIKVSFTYKELGKGLGVSPSLISSMINHGHVPLLDSLLTICDGLDYPYTVTIKNANGVRKVEVIGPTAPIFFKSNKHQKSIDSIRLKAMGV